jgi:uncharacterized protein YegP (UPF0339 family)
MSKFEIFQDKKKQWRFRLIASNGRIVCQSEGYTRKANCLATAERLAEIAFRASIVVLD